MKEKLILIFKRYQELEIKKQYIKLDEKEQNDKILIRQRIRDKTELKYKIIIKTLLASYSLEKFTMTNDPI